MASTLDVDVISFYQFTDDACTESTGYDMTDCACDQCCRKFTGDSGAEMVGRCWLNQ